MRLFGPWVEVATNLMDGDGAWAGYLWPGPLMEQPETDMVILSAIRGKWNELRAEESRRSGSKRQR